MATGITNTDYAKNKIIAAYLAQEGIEYIRNMRDTYVLYYNSTNSPPYTDWTNGFIVKLNSASCFLGNGCYFSDLVASSYTPPSAQSMTNIQMNLCTNFTCSTNPLLYDSSSGTYGYTKGSNSGFVRQIKATSINANTIRVSSIVYWKQGSNSYNITLSEDLFNWFQH